MDVHLVVVRAFGRHAKGDVVASPAEIEAIEAGEHAGSVVRVLMPADGEG